MPLRGVSNLGLDDLGRRQHDDRRAGGCELWLEHQLRGVLDLGGRRLATQRKRIGDIDRRAQPGSLAQRDGARGGSARLGLAGCCVHCLGALLRPSANTCSHADPVADSESHAHAVADSTELDSTTIVSTARAGAVRLLGSAHADRRPR